MHLKEVIIDLLQDKKAQNIQAVSLKGISAIADYFIVATGNSSTQVRALVDHLSKELYQREGILVKREGKEDSGWVLVDAGDVVVHIFTESMRNYYEIERVWCDASIETILS